LGRLRALSKMGKYVVSPMKRRICIMEDPDNFPMVD
jgi:hypothetical protein